MPTDTLEATPRNMRHCAARGLPVVAIDELTGATYSATAADYFWVADDEALTGSEGLPLILVVRLPVQYRAVS